MYIKLGIVTQFSIYETFCDGVRIVWRNGEWGGVLQSWVLWQHFP